MELRKRAYAAPVIILTGMSHEVPEKRVAEAVVSQVLDKLAGTNALLDAIQAAVLANPD